MEFEEIVENDTSATYRVFWRLEGETDIRADNEDHAVDHVREGLKRMALAGPVKTLCAEPEMLGCTVIREDYCTCALPGAGMFCCPRHYPEIAAQMRDDMQSAIAQDFQKMVGVEHESRIDHPKHYLNLNARIDPDEHDLVEIDGILWRPVECIELLRHIKDPRMAHVFVYVWRICFGGKDDDAEDAGKARWFLNDFIEHPSESHGSV